MIGSPDLYWLPPPPPNWRQRVLALSNGVQGDDAWREAVALAKARLQFAATNALDAASKTFGTRSTRLAVLSSSTSVHLGGALRVGALRRGIGLDVYNGPFAQYRQEVTDPKSGLHGFVPTHVLFAFDAGLVGAHAKSASTRDEAKMLASRLLDDWRHLWRTTRDRTGAAIMQQTVMPRVAHAGGSNEHRLPTSGSAFVALVNEALRDVAEMEGVDLVALDDRVGQDGLDRWFDAASWHAAKQEVSLPAAPMYGDMVARVIAARQGRAAKCCVLDLDNTLWGGVVGDDGLGGIKIGMGSAAGEAFVDVQAYVLALRQRGILLAVCSKNDETVARTPFDRHPDMLLKSADISCFVANWRDKATNLRRIAEHLDIGLDSLVFVDDNPFEREQVRAALPDVFVPQLPEDPALIPRCLADSGCFELVSLTKEDTCRAALYAADARRFEAQDHAADIEAYLSDLGMVLEWSRIEETDVVRVTQLINKTNQFNLATRRLTEAQLRALIAEESVIALRFRLSDRFGDNGIIAVLIGHESGEDAFKIDDWLMSCRVIGRKVEDASLNVLVARLLESGYTRLFATYRPTGRNGIVADLLDRLGFETRTRVDETIEGVLDLQTFPPRAAPIKIKETSR